MAYSFNGNDLESCRALCENFYNSMFDEVGHVNTFNSNESGELTGEYLGATKDDFYYYRGYYITKNVSGSTNKFGCYGSNCRFPYNVNDNVVRPFFALKTMPNGSHNLSVYIGAKNRSSNPSWNFNTNRYGDANRDYDTNLFNGTNYCISSAYLNPKFGGENSSATINRDTISKNTSMSNNYTSAFSYKFRVISTSGIYNYLYPYYYGADINDDIKAVKFDTNIPCFDAGDLDSIINWVENGVLENVIELPFATATKYKLWIQGLDSPTYKLNWHNEELESQKFDFDKTVVKLSCGVHGSDGVFYHELENSEYNDGSLKFTWYDMDSLVNTNLIQNSINLDIITSYTDEKGKVHDSAPCRVDLYQKASNFIEMYGNIENGSDGSSIEVINYDDDKDGFDSDDDDYHDPEDNTDDTQDESTNISVSGEVCKTFQISDIELRKLSKFLWSSNFFENFLLVNNIPIENIISLKAVIGNASTTGSSQVLTLGNVESTVNVIPCAETITINVGGITIPKKYNNFLDFEPYTKVQIYLPFYGTAMLNSSLVIGRRIDIVYIIDVITGTAKISIKHKNKTLYEYKTTCACDLPLTSSNRASVEMGYISSGLGMGVSLASGNVIGAIASGLSMAQSQFSSNTNGNVSGVVDFHDSRMVTVMVDRPVYSDLKMFNKTHGRMCNLSKTLKNLKGYTKCADNVQLPFNCLDKEREMIIDLLTSGVIL